MKKLVALIMLVGAFSSTANADQRIVSKSYTYATVTSYESAQSAFEMIQDKRSQISHKNKQLRKNAAYDNCRLPNSHSRYLKVGQVSIKQTLIVRNDEVMTAWTASVGYSLKECIQN